MKQYRVFVILSAVCIATILGMAGCGQSACAKPAGFEMSRLLLDETTLPQGWLLGSTSEGAASAEIGERSQENIARKLIRASPANKEIVATQTVWRYCTPTEARSWYVTMLKQYRSWGWDTRDKRDVGFVSPSTQDFNVFCSDISGSSQVFCRATGRYESFVMELATYVDGNSVFFSDLDQMLAIADRIMSSEVAKLVK